jgi:hypothetical protein
MKKIFLILCLMSISGNVISNEIHLQCEYEGKSYRNDIEDANLKGSDIFTINEKKQTIYSAEGGGLCNMTKAFGIFKEYTLIDKKNIYHQCKVSNIKNMNYEYYEEVLRINRISGVYSTTTNSILKDGVKIWYGLKGLCNKTDAKF